MSEVIKRRLELARLGEHDAMGNRHVKFTTWDRVKKNFMDWAPMVLGHGKRKTEDAALGAITAVHIDGEVLLGDAEFSPELVDLIRSRKFFNRSVEVSVGPDGEPERLLAVSWLGGILPAVKGLAPVELAGGKSAVVCFAEGSELFPDDAVIRFAESLEGGGGDRFLRAASYAKEHGVSFAEAARMTAD